MRMEFARFLFYFRLIFFDSFFFYQGQLGLGDTLSRPSFTTVMKDKSITKISCGLAHSMFYKKTGEIFVFGESISGQLGLESKGEVTVPSLLMKVESLAILLSGASQTNWSIHSHLNFPQSFQLSVTHLFLCLQRLRNETKLKIPRFVIYEIIKFSTD